MVRAMKALIQFRVDDELKRKAMEKAGADGDDLSDVLRDFLRTYTRN